MSFSTLKGAPSAFLAYCCIVLVKPLYCCFTLPDIICMTALPFLFDLRLSHCAVMQPLYTVCCHCCSVITFTKQWRIAAIITYTHFTIINHIIVRQHVPLLLVSLKCTVVFTLWSLNVEVTEAKPHSFCHCSGCAPGAMSFEILSWSVCKLLDPFSECLSTNIPGKPK